MFMTMFSTSRQSSMSRPKYTLTVATLAAFGIFFFFCDHSDQFGLQSRFITRFCYNSPNLSTLNVSTRQYIRTNMLTVLLLSSDYFFHSFTMSLCHAIMTLFTESMCIMQLLPIRCYGRSLLMLHCVTLN